MPPAAAVALEDDPGRFHGLREGDARDASPTVWRSITRPSMGAG